MIYVIDAPALLGIELAAGSQAIRIFNELHDLVENKSLVFCDETLAHLERLADEDASHLWAKGAISDCFHRGAHYGYVVSVIHACERIIDPLAKPTAESAAAHVIAQALELQTAGKSVTVVTADRADKPTRASVREGCECVGIDSIGVAEFLDDTGLLQQDDSDPPYIDEDDDWDDDWAEQQDAELDDIGQEDESEDDEFDDED